jgi:ADP-ribose pyrophosphatase YjhB (NUDIX family)
MSPVVAGVAAVIDTEGNILLMRRSDNQLWAMPGGQMEVGETPAEAVVRETVEETGIRCIPKALVGVYDSRIWDKGIPHHVYKFTFLCEPVSIQTMHPLIDTKHLRLDGSLKMICRMISMKDISNASPMPITLGTDIFQRILIDKTV